MPMIEFSDKDIKRGKLIAPAWYRVRIDNVEDQLSKNGDSTNTNLDGTIIKNADTGDTEFAEFPTPRWSFNSKAPGFAIGLLAAFGIDAEKGKRYELKSFEGKDIEVMIENELYDGRMVNRINHKYRKASE